MRIDHYEISEPDDAPDDLPVRVVVTGDLPIRQRDFELEFRLGDVVETAYVVNADLDGTVVAQLAQLPPFGSTLHFGYWGENLVEFVA